MKVHEVSSRLTPFAKLFFPVFWMAFFGAFAIAALLTDMEPYTHVSNGTFRLGVVGFFLAGAALLLLTLVRLKWVAFDESQIYVSNYFKQYRYPWSLVTAIEERDLVLASLVTIRFAQKGYFGDKIHFLANERRLQRFLDEHPHLAGLLARKLEKQAPDARV